MKKAMLFLLITSFSSSVFAGPHWLSGTIINVTSNREGLLVMFSGQAVPDNCAGTPSGWMQVKTEDTVMVATVLSVWSRGKLSATVYTDAKGQEKFCAINQFDPAG